MKVPNPAAVVEPRSNPVFRSTVVVLAALLAVQCAWLLLAELSRSGIRELPTDNAAAAKAAEHDAAYRAAAIGGIRGELWAEAGFTNAVLLWDDKAAMAEPGETLQGAHKALDRALRDAPAQSAAWLLLAGVALRFQIPDVNAIECLKVAYYTGPSEQHLIPLRLRIAAQLSKLDDIELRELVGRDIRLLLQSDKPAIATAYGAASPAGRKFIEQTVKDIDPAAIGVLRSESPKHSVPD